MQLVRRARTQGSGSSGSGGGGGGGLLPVYKGKKMKDVRGEGEGDDFGIRTCVSVGGVVVC